MMKECFMSEILEDKMQKNETMRIQTTSGSFYEGIIKRMDCLGVLFIPSDRTGYDPAYILYTDIKKFMLPEH